MNDHPGWQMRFTMTRDPAAPEMFGYAVRGASRSAPATTHGFRSSTARSSRRAVRARGDGPLPHAGRRSAGGGFPLATDGDGNWFKSLDVMYSTARLSDQRVDDARALPEGTTSRTSLTIALPLRGAGERPGRRWSSREPTATSGSSLSVTSRWLATGAGPGRRDRGGRHGRGGDADRVLGRLVQVGSTTTSPGPCRRTRYHGDPVTLS